jgi:hypothetical protein
MKAKVAQDRGMEDRIELVPSFCFLLVDFLQLLPKGRNGVRLESKEECPPKYTFSDSISLWISPSYFYSMSVSLA